MTAAHSNPNPTLRHQTGNWFLPALSALLLSASAAGLRAQDPPVTPGENGAPPATRAGEIELARSQKAAHLEPEVQDRTEHDLHKSQDDRIAERIFGGAPGLGLQLGGLIVGSGFALGPEYDTPLLNNQAEFRTSVSGPVRKYYVMDAGLSMSRLVSGHYFLKLYSAHSLYPRVPYYGPGMDSRKTGQSYYRRENTTFQTTTGFKFFRYFRLGGIGRPLIYNLGSGTDHEYAEADSLYAEAAPGILTNSNFFQDGGFLKFDYRYTTGDPHFGGNYLAEFSTFNDVRRELAPVFYSIAVLDLKIVKWAKKG
jgi:hypothetical protein